MSNILPRPSFGVSQSFAALIGRLRRWPAYERLKYRWCDPLLDRLHNIDTWQEVDHTALGFGPATGCFYQASGWRTLRSVLPSATVTTSDVFLDYGSGKGRVVYQAAQYPFGRVTGVEISEALNQIARRNIERNRRCLRCRQVELITTNAATYPLPDDVTVIYLFNPFWDEVFSGVVGQISASLARRPRRLRLIYQRGRPAQQAQLEAAGLRVSRRSGHSVIYQFEPQGAGGS